MSLREKVGKAPEYPGGGGGGYFVDYTSRGREGVGPFYVYRLPGNGTRWGTGYRAGRHRAVAGEHKAAARPVPHEGGGALAALREFVGYKPAGAR